MAPTVELLIFARLIQGIGGALLTPGSLAIIEASFRPADRARAIGAWSGLGGVATAFGPLLGGWLIAAISWRAIFLINLPIGVFVVWAAARHVPESRDPNATGKLDLGRRGARRDRPRRHHLRADRGARRQRRAAVVATAVIGVASLIGFFWQERRSANPMLPLSIFRSRQFSAANAVTFVVYAALGVVFFLLVSFLQISMGYTPIEAGSASLPVTALMLVGSARAGALAQRIGPRIPLTVGPLIIAAGLLLMLRINPGDSYVDHGAAGGDRLRPRPDPGRRAGHRDGAGGGRLEPLGDRLGGQQRGGAGGGPAGGRGDPGRSPGITGDKFYEPSHMTHGFHIGMMVCAVLALARRRSSPGRRSPPTSSTTRKARTGGVRLQLRRRRPRPAPRPRARPARRARRRS